MTAIFLEALAWTSVAVLGVALGALGIQAIVRWQERKAKDMSAWRPQHRPSVHDFDWHLHS